MADHKLLIYVDYCDGEGSIDFLFSIKLFKLSLELTFTVTIFVSGVTIHGSFTDQYFCDNIKLHRLSQGFINKIESNFVQQEFQWNFLSLPPPIWLILPMKI